MPSTSSRCAIHASTMPGMLGRRARVGSTDGAEELGIAADDNLVAARTCPGSNTMSELPANLSLCRVRAKVSGQIIYEIVRSGVGADEEVFQQGVQIVDADGVYVCRVSEGSEFPAREMPPRLLAC